MKPYHIIHCCPELVMTVFKVSVLPVNSYKRPVCRYSHYLLAVGLKQLILCIHECTAHAGHLVKQHEQILEGNRCHSSVFLRYLYLFLCLYSLMLTTAQLYTMHETSCRSVKQLYLLLVSDNIILFVLQKLVRPKRKRDMPVYLKILFAVEIGYAKEALGKLHTLWSEPDGLILLYVVDILHKCRDEKITYIVQVRLNSRHSRYDERHNCRV